MRHPISETHAGTSAISSTFRCPASVSGARTPLSCPKGRGRSSSLSPGATIPAASSSTCSRRSKCVRRIDPRCLLQRRCESGVIQHNRTARTAIKLEANDFELTQIQFPAASTRGPGSAYGRRQSPNSGCAAVRKSPTIGNPASNRRRFPSRSERSRDTSYPCDHGHRRR
jgi:hypothetical protein